MVVARSVQLWATIAALTLAPLFFGSVDQFWIAVWVIVLSIGTLCGTANPMSVGQRRLLCAFVIGCVAYASVAAIQIVPGFSTDLSDPVWRRAGDLLGVNLPARISSRAEIPPVAIGHFLLVATSFMSGFFVGTSRRSSDTLSTFARYAILLYAIYGLLAYTFTPNMLLWAPKTAYRGSLTASFVNHNTAATFIGAGAILWFCSAYLTLQSLELRSLRLLLLDPSNEDVAFRLILQSAAAFTCFFALLLTGSRAGLICSCFGLVVAIGLITASRLEARFWYILGCSGAALTVTIAWLSQTGRIGSQGLFDDGRWSVYGYCIEAIRQRPWLGAGAGTFAELFPSLKGTDSTSWGVWDFAHSTILEIAVEMGIPIAALVALGAVTSIAVLARGTLTVKDRSRGAIAAMAGIAVLSYLHSLVDFSLQIPGYLIVFWILLGCWLARSLAEEPPARKTSTGNQPLTPPLMHGRLRDAESRSDLHRGEHAA